MHEVRIVTPSRNRLPSTTLVSFLLHDAPWRRRKSSPTRPHNRRSIEVFYPLKFKANTRDITTDTCISSEAINSQAAGAIYAKNMLWTQMEIGKSNPLLAEKLLAPSLDNDLLQLWYRRQTSLLACQRRRFFIHTLLSSITRSSIQLPNAITPEGDRRIPVLFCFQGLLNFSLGCSYPRWGNSFHMSLQAWVMVTIRDRRWLVDHRRGRIGKITVAMGGWWLLLNNPVVAGGVLVWIRSLILEGFDEFVKASGEQWTEHRSNLENVSRCLTQQRRGLHKPNISSGSRGSRGWPAPDQKIEPGLDFLRYSKHRPVPRQTAKARFQLERWMFLCASRQRAWRWWRPIQPLGTFRGTTQRGEKLVTSHQRGPSFAFLPIPVQLKCRLQAWFGPEKRGQQQSEPAKAERLPYSQWTWKHASFGKSASGICAWPRLFTSLTNLARSVEIHSLRVPVSTYKSCRRHTAENLRKEQQCASDPGQRTDERHSDGDLCQG